MRAGAGMLVATMLIVAAACSDDDDLTAVPASSVPVAGCHDGSRTVGDHRHRDERASGSRHHTANDDGACGVRHDRRRGCSAQRSRPVSTRSR